MHLRLMHVCSIYIAFVKLQRTLRTSALPRNDRQSGHVHTYVLYVYVYVSMFLSVTLISETSDTISEFSLTGD